MHVCIRSATVYVDDPVKMGPKLRQHLGLSSEYQCILMDVGHILFSRLGRLMKSGHPSYCKAQHYLPNSSTAIIYLLD